jgi:two-component system, response regulator YesN
MIGIVIVEDETYIRKGMVVTTPWEQLGCKVIGEAGDGQEGYELISRLKPDIVITDVNMPVMDGIEMLRKLEGDSNAEYIIISGYNDFAYAQQAIKLGVRDYLLKPIDDDDFYRTIKKVTLNIEKKRRIARQQERSLLIRDGKEILAKEEGFDANHDSRQLYVMKAMEWIEVHYSENIGISDAALELKISESYLSRLFKSHMGFTFVEYLTDYRIREAIELLKDHHIKIYEVSEKVGYNDPKYFGILFKKKIGVSPMTFKNSYMSND